MKYMLGLLLSALCSWSSIHAQGPLYLQTKLGWFHGKEFQIENKPMQAFLGVKYAEQPTGKNRWRKTAPLKSWYWIEDATRAKAPCPQLLDNGTFIGNEDCLYLDIVVNGRVTDEKKKPVIVFLNNDNSFQSGITHSAALLARREEVVTVYVYSRLGVFGYLYDGPGTGTMGLWDNLEALRWIQENIGYFSGNSSQVTVVGIDSGALIAQVLSSTPLSDGLFSRIVSMSPLSQGTFSNSGANIRQIIRDAAECQDSQVVSCDLSHMSSKDITNLTAKYVIALDTETMKQDKDLFPVYDPTRIQKFDLMIGTTSAESLRMSIRLTNSYTETTNGTITSSAMKDLIKSICQSAFKDGAAQCLCQRTMEDKFEVSSADNKKIYSLSNIRKISGGFLRADYLDTLNIHTLSNISNLYTFFVDIKEALEILSLQLADNSGSDTAVTLKLVLGYPYFDYGNKYEILNRDLYGGNLFNGIPPIHMYGGIPSMIDLRPQSAALMNYVANFAKFGDPKGGKDVTNWPDYKTAKQTMAFVEASQNLISTIPDENVYNYFRSVIFESKKCSTNSR